MAGNQGGPRPGAGRKPNGEVYRDQIASTSDRIAGHLDEIFEKGMELVRGVEVQKIVRGEEVVYSLPPCAKTIQYFMDRIMGKPRQAVELSNGDDGPLKIQVIYADPEPDPAEAPPGPAEDPPGDEAV